MTRSTYHHGDLRAALVEAGLAVTRDGGPESLSMRDVTRRAGVSPNAAYRHFADRTSLLGAIAAEVQEQMAEGMRPPESNSADPVVTSAGPDADAEHALARLRAVGVGYIEYALTEPGWFSTTFFSAGRPALDRAGEERPAPPYVALMAALDACQRTGVLTPEQRQGAEWPCWSAVHGFAELALRGPLAGQPLPALRDVGARVVDSIIGGLTTAPSATPGPATPSTCMS